MGVFYYCLYVRQIMRIFRTKIGDLTEIVKVNLSLLQAVEARKVVRGRGSHIT
jgi:hypothetical protein